MTSSYFTSSRRSLSGYEKDLISGWGMSRRTVKFVSSLRVVKGTEWQLTDKETSKVASMIHELGFEKFVELTQSRGTENRTNPVEEGPVSVGGDWYSSRELGNLYNL